MSCWVVGGYGGTQKTLFQASLCPLVFLYEPGREEGCSAMAQGLILQSVARGWTQSAPSLLDLLGFSTSLHYFRNINF